MRYLTSGYWYPMRVEYRNIPDNISTQYGDICVRYQLPSSDERRILSAGVCNYPDSNIKWDDASDASFINEDIDSHYLELPDIISIEGDRGVGTVGQYTITIPLSEETYIPIKNLKGHYKHKDYNIVIRPGRLIDIWAGFHTRCRNYVDADQSCSVGLLPVASGGYLAPNLCTTLNSRCPLQQSMPGDFVKRFRGRIISLEANRTREESTLIITCQDNLYYLNSTINENFPNFISYAHFDYAGLKWNRTRPDGINKPITYDNFLLSEAVMDSCIKAGIDPIM